MIRARVFLVVLLLFFCSCQTKKEVPEFGGVLRLGIYHTPSKINPVTTDSTISANLLDLIFSTLVRFSGDGVIHPELAKAWDVSPDGLTWTFHLRDDVFFHDGTPLTAADVEFTFQEHLKSQRSGYRYTFKCVKGMKALDARTFQIYLSQTDSFLWNALGEIGIAPKKMALDPEYHQFNQHPIGSGPYEFVKQDGQEIVLKAYEKYFAGRPYLDRIIVQILSNQTASLNYLIADKTDMTFLINPQDYGALEKIPSIRIYNNWYPSLYMMPFRLDHPIFKDADVVHALSMAIDKNLLIEKILRGKGVVAGTTDPDEIKSDKRYLPPYPYQPAEALKILKSKGWHEDPNDFLLHKGSLKFSFQVLAIQGDELSTKVLQFIQQQFRDIGIQMEIEPLPLDQYIQRVYRERHYEAHLVNNVFRSIYYDNHFSFWHSSQIEQGLNHSGYRNAGADHFLEQTRLELDLVKRQQAFHEFQKVFYEKPPVVLLFWRSMPIALNRRFRGVPETRMETLRDLIRVWTPKNEQLTSLPGKETAP